MSNKLLSTKVLEGLQYRSGDTSNITEETTAALAVWIAYKGTTGTLQRLGATDIASLKKNLDFFDHILNGDWDKWTLTSHPLNNGFSVASDLGIANPDAFIFDAALVKVDGTWMVQKSNGAEEPADADRAAYHEKVNWFIKGDSVALYIPQFKNHSEYMESVDETLRSGVGNVISAFDKKVDENHAEREQYLADRPFAQNGIDDNGKPAQSKAPTGVIVRLLDGSRLNMNTVPNKTVFGVYSDGTFVYNRTWVSDKNDPTYEIRLESWQAIAKAEHLSVSKDATL